MIKLYDSNITDILPKALAKRPDVMALGYAIKMAMQRLIEYSRTTSVYSAIDTAPDYVLDMLALDLDAQYYDDTLDIEAKRRLIKNTMKWYSLAGTPAAVENLVASVFGEGEVKEWFQYGGEPFMFKIFTNATLTEDANEVLSKMIQKVKNTRSHLETVITERTINQSVFVGAAMEQVGIPNAIIEILNDLWTAYTQTHAGIALRSAIQHEVIVFREV